MGHVAINHTVDFPFFVKYCKNHLEAVEQTPENTFYGKMFAARS